MSSTMTNNDLRRHGQVVVDEAVTGAERVRDTAAGEVSKLIADVEDLVKKVANVTDGDIARVRDKVEKTLAATKKSVEESAATLRASSKKAADATDAYVHERPWTAIGIAAAVGVLLGVLSARR